MSVVLVHGFNVTDEGESSVGRLAPYFNAVGYRCERMKYGWRGLLGVAALNSTFSEILADLTEPGDIAVGHSNGCAIIMAALEKGAQFSQVVFINPALDRDHPFPPGPRAIQVWHSPSDEPVKLARILPWSAWGDMGAVGYQGRPDARVTNYNKQSDYRYSSCGHSDVFSDELIPFFGPLIARTTQQNDIFKT